MKRKKNPAPHTLVLKEDGQLQWVTGDKVFTVGDIPVDDLRASQELGKKLAGHGLKKPSTEI